MIIAVITVAITAAAPTKYAIKSDVIILFSERLGSNSVLLSAII